MTYWALNAIVLAVVAIVGILAILRARGSRHPALLVPVLVTLVVLLVVTAVFDNVMIGVGLVGYDRARISGAFVGMAPLEDFAYAVAAALLLPSLWILLGRKGDA